MQSGQPSLSAVWIIKKKDPRLIHVDSEDYGQTVDMQADLSLCLPHRSFFIGIAMPWLNLLHLEMSIYGTYPKDLSKVSIIEEK